MRSCWDYHLRGDEFTAWLRRAAHEVPVLNAAETVLWTHNKFYLRQVHDQGIEIAPTIFAAGAAALAAAERSQIESWPKVVVKPAVSTWHTRPGCWESATFPSSLNWRSRMGGAPFLIQQFIPEIQTNGEISFIYIDGIFQPCGAQAAGCRRFPRAEGARRLGGTVCSTVSALLDQANQIAAAVPQVRESLYCRIDAITTQWQACADRAGVD